MVETVLQPPTVVVRLPLPVSLKHRSASTTVGVSFECIFRVIRKDLGEEGPQANGGCSGFFGRVRDFRMEPDKVNF